MFRLIISLFFIISVGACSATKVVDIKSPCVGRNGSVCERFPINTWMNQSVMS